MGFAGKSHQSEFIKLHW